MPLFQYATKSGGLSTPFEAADSTTAQRMMGTKSDVAAGSGVISVNQPGQQTQPVKQQPTNQTQDTTVAPPTTQSKTGNIPMPDTSGFSASFLSAGNAINELNKNVTDILNPTAAEQQARSMHDIAASNIKTSTDINREEIQSALRAGTEQIQKARGFVNMSDIQVKSQVDDLVSSAETFYGNISRSLERLGVEENNAIASNDQQYLQNVRQSKLDLINAQRQSITDSLQFITTAYNTMMSGASFQLQQQQTIQQQATNNLNTMINAYAGSGYTLDTLSPQARANIIESGTRLGLDSSTLNMLLKGTADTQIIHDTATGWIMAVDKRGNIISKTLAPGRTGAAIPSLSQIVGDLTSSARQLLPIGSQADIGTYASVMNIWSQTAPSQLGTFFKIFPIDQYVDKNNPNMNAQQKKLYQDLSTQSKTYVNNNQGSAAMLQSLIDGTLSTFQQ